MEIHILIWEAFKLNKYEKRILEAYRYIGLPKHIFDSNIYFYYAGYVEKLMSGTKYNIELSTLFDKEYLDYFNDNLNKLDQNEKSEVLEFYYLLKLVFIILKKYSEK